jgi:hypothetical protein
MPRVRTFSSFAKLHESLSKLRDGWIFRGHADATWKLVPKAGRAPYWSGEPKRDAHLFDKWKRQAVGYLSSRLPTDWDWLAVAQHHGLATRLLDWSTNR